MSHPINFSPEPFLAPTPRLILLWIANIGFIAMIIFFSWRWVELRRLNEDAHQSIQAVTDQESRSRQDAQNDLEQLAAIDIKRHRKDVGQYDTIQRAFSAKWSVLLDELSALLNEDVRIVRLRSLQPERVSDGAHQMELRAQARNKPAELAFIRSLQNHPAFGKVRFSSEQYEARQITFDLNFGYQSEKVTDEP